MGKTVSVIIPFYQREPGILTRALELIQLQQIPDGWRVEVIVVDDASPCPAINETRNMAFGEPVHLKVVGQENGGVAAARNRGLDEVSNETSLIAFLDFRRYMASPSSRARDPSARRQLRLLFHG